MAKPSQIIEALKIFMETHGDADISMLDICNFYYLGNVNSKGVKIGMYKTETKEIVKVEPK